MGLNQEALWAHARTVMPGGVSSPVRAFRAVGGDPRFLVAGQGAEVTDADGARYIDLNMAWGPLILGHAHPRVVEAVSETVRQGLHFGACHPLEQRLADAVVSAHPAAEKVRFVTSGTEAVMSAVRLARHATGRDKVVAFQGGYHGHADAFLAAGGSGMATFGLEGAPGVPATAVGDTALLPLDDLDAARAFFEAHGDEVACILIEGIPANNGLLLQDETFMRGLQELAHAHGALFILDEVITGFRLGPGGATARHGLRPDLVTFGKVLGGGAPLAAFAGRAGLMDLLAPDGPVYQAGTLSGSPVALAAGLATLETLADDPPYDLLARRTRDLTGRLADAAADAGLPAVTAHAGSIFWTLLDAGSAPRTPDGIRPEAVARYRMLHGAALREGVYLAPSAHEVAFLSTAHDDRVLDTLTERLARAFAHVATHGTEVPA